jgi:putative membrane protein
MAADPARRRPAAVYGTGTEPDPRFSMANERTALAWLRMSLAMLAGGVGLASLARLTDLPDVLDLLAGCSCALGAWASVVAATGWRARERAMRTGQPLPAPTPLLWLAVAIVVLSLVAGVYIVTGL